MAQGEESACNARDVGLISGLGRFPGEGNCKPTPVILTWEIPWTEEPGAYSPWGFKRVEHNSETKQQQFRAGPRKLGQLKMSPWGLLHLGTVNGLRLNESGLSILKTTCF